MRVHSREWWGLGHQRAPPLDMRDPMLPPAASKFAKKPGIQLGGVKFSPSLSVGSKLAFFFF